MPPETSEYSVYTHNRLRQRWDFTLDGTTVVIQSVLAFSNFQLVHIVPFDTFASCLLIPECLSLITDLIVQVARDMFATTITYIRITKLVTTQRRHSSKLPQQPTVHLLFFCLFAQVVLQVKFHAMLLVTLRHSETRSVVDLDA